MEHYADIIVEKAEFNHSEWLEALFTKLPNRSSYGMKENNFCISTVTGRIIGIPENELDYFFDLRQLYHSSDVYIFNNEIQKLEITESSESIQRITNKAQKTAGLSINRLVALLKKENMVPTHRDPAVEKLLQQSLVHVLETLKEKYPQLYAHPDFTKIVTDLLSWIERLFVSWMQKADMEQAVPRIIWYGEAEKSQLYFLYFAMLAGCDVLILNPEGNDQFLEIDPEETISFAYWLPESLTKQPLQREVPSRSETIAYRSTRQFNEVLLKDNTSIYKAWQFNEYMPQAITLKTTYDELYLIAKEKAFVRPEFKVGKGIVSIPNVFAQVLGMSKNKKEYWDRIHKLMELEQTRVIRHFPFSEEEKVDYTLFFREALNNKGSIDPERLKRSSIWLYNHLPISRQDAIASAISRLCEKDILLPLPGESPEEVRLYLFTQVTNLSEEGLKWIQIFDYAQTVPKLILYYNEQSGILSRSDAAKLLLLNELGFDIIIYNPPGHVSIEKYVNKEAFDSHMLDEMAFGQKFKNPSIFKKSFGM